MKRIVICSGGTGKDGQIEDPQTWSNVSRIERCIRDADGAITQVKWAQPGLGTQPPQKFSYLAAVGPYSVPARIETNVFSAVQNALSGAFGLGFHKHITAAYLKICAEYSPGDSIVLIGFSRGAFIVRCLASLIDEVGLFIDVNGFTTALYDGWKDCRAKGRTWRDKPKYQSQVHPSVRITAIGVWDTVSELASYSEFNWVKNTVPRCVEHAFQALALDESRNRFPPEVWTMWDGGQEVRQVWFPGCHSHVGGGSKNATNIGNMALVWMIELLRPYLAFDMAELERLVRANQSRAAAAGDVRPVIKDSRTIGWRLFFEDLNGKPTVRIPSNYDGYSPSSESVHWTVHNAELQKLLGLTIGRSSHLKDLYRFTSQSGGFRWCVRGCVPEGTPNATSVCRCGQSLPEWVRTDLETKAMGWMGADTLAAGGGGPSNDGGDAYPPNGPPGGSGPSHPGGSDRRGGSLGTHTGHFGHVGGGIGGSGSGSSSSDGRREPTTSTTSRSWQTSSHAPQYPSSYDSYAPSFPKDGGGQHYSPAGITAAPQTDTSTLRVSADSPYALSPGPSTSAHQTTGYDQRPDISAITPWTYSSTPYTSMRSSYAGKPSGYDQATSLDIGKLSMHETSYDSQPPVSIHDDRYTDANSVDIGSQKHAFPTSSSSESAFLNGPTTSSRGKTQEEILPRRKRTDQTPRTMTQSSTPVQEQEVSSQAANTWIWSKEHERYYRYEYTESGAVNYIWDTSQVS